jgi:hypothetical protein
MLMKLVFSGLSQPRKKYSKIKNPDRALPPARMKSVHGDRWDGAAMSYSGVERVISVTTLATVGINVSPHLFRTAAASTAAVYAGNSPHLASALLHHTDRAVTEEHYNRANTSPRSDRSVAAAGKFGRQDRRSIDYPAGANATPHQLYAANRGVAFQRRTNIKAAPRYRELKPRQALLDKLGSLITPAPASCAGASTLALNHLHMGAHRDAVIEINDVLIEQADAAA